MAFSLLVKRRALLSLTVFILAISYLFHNASFWLRATSTIAFLLVFYVIDHYFEVSFKLRHYIFAYVIMISGILLSPLYYYYPYYDKVLHFLIPILYCSIVLFMVSKLNLKIKWELVFTLFVVVGSLALFELGEYGLDYFFNLKLQGVYLRDLQGLEKYDLVQDKLSDTMNDILLGTLGSLLFVGAKAGWIIIKKGYRYLHRARQKIPPHRRSHSPHALR